MIATYTHTYKDILSKDWASLVVQKVETACNARDTGSISGLGRFLGEGNGNPLQCSCLEYSMDRGAWRATVHRAAESLTQLSDFCTH